MQPLFLARSIGVTLALAVCISLWSVESEAAQTSEQLVFNAIEDVRKPFTVPDELLAVMKLDPYVRENLTYEGISTGQPPRSWFRASVVHLAGSSESDVVLIGMPPLMGANVTQFWVLPPVGHSYEVLLQATALGLSVKEGRLNGYRNIETGAATTVEITTRFDGHQYKPHSQNTKRLR